MSPECAAEFNTNQVRVIDHARNQFNTNLIGRARNGFNTNQFRVIGHVRNWTVLDMLEVAYITTLQPELCKQTQSVKTLHLFVATVNSSDCSIVQNIGVVVSSIEYCLSDQTSLTRKNQY